MQITITNGTLSQISETLSASLGYGLPEESKLLIDGATVDSYSQSTGVLTLAPTSDTIEVEANGVQTITLDISALSGWGNVSAGTHTLTIKAKATGYYDSQASAGVQFTKAASGYTLTVVEAQSGGTFDITYNNSTTDNVGQGTYNSVRSVDDVHYNEVDVQHYWINDVSELALPYTLTQNTVARVQSRASGECFIAGTQISLANGETKAIENISANDDILVWDFDNGELSSAKPAVVYDLGKVKCYEKLTFSDGSKCNTIKHRLFNVDEGKFTYSTEDQFPIGSKTLNKLGEIVELVSREKVFDKEGIEYYNMRTKYHIDYFIDGVLSGTRLANVYPIIDKKYIKDNREIIPYELFPRLTYEQYIDARVGEQPFINRDGDVDLGDKDIQDYLLRLEDKNIL